MCYTQISSLKQTALTKVISVIINESHLYGRLLSSFAYFPRLEIRRKKVRLRVENTILGKVSQLTLPEVLKEKLACFVRPSLLQIEAFLLYNYMYCHLRENAPTFIFWTPQGTINKKETAKLLVENKYIDVCIRFEIACVYCLENYIYSLWPELPKERHKDYEMNVCSSRYQALWAYLAGANHDQLHAAIGSCTLYEFGLHTAASSGNDVACQYFLKKSTSEDKEKALVGASKVVMSRRDIYHIGPLKIFYTDLLCILLSAMNEEQQIQLYMTNAHSVLKCFFDCPWQNLSSKIFPSFWTFLQSPNYYYVFGKLKRRISKGKTDYDYQAMFTMFWQKIPDDEKKTVIDYCISNQSLLIELFEALEERNMRLILNDVVASMGVKIIFDNHGRKIYEGLMYHNKWDSFKFFLEKCGLSKVTMIRLKEEIESHISVEEANSPQINISREILDKLIQEYDERENVEEDNLSAKRFCSMKN